METYRRLLDTPAFETLVDWGDTYLGAVTGRSGFLTLDQEAVFLLRIPPEELVRISPPGSRHLRDLEFDDERWKKLLDDGRSCYLLMPDADAPSRDALEYIRAAEVIGVQTAYKCRVRAPGGGSQPFPSRTSS